MIPPLATDWLPVLIAPIWGLVVAVLALVCAWLFRRPLRRIASDLGVTRLNFLGIDFEWVVDQTTEVYEHRGLAPPGAAELKSFARLSGTLAPLVNGRRVLWVDDNPGWVATETKLLRGLHVDVMPAADTERAIELLDSNPAGFDLIISDWTRDGQEAGPELLEQAQARGHRQPCIFYVSDASANRRSRAAILGAVAVTSLPDELLKHALIELATAR